MKRLTLTAVESLALLNVLPDRYRPDLPLKTLHLEPAALDPKKTYQLVGRNVRCMFGKSEFFTRERSTFPNELYCPLPVIEPVVRKTGVPVADLLQVTDLCATDRKPLLPAHARRCTPQESRMSVYVTELRLRRVNDLSDADITALGARRVGDSFTFRPSGEGFATLQLALEDHWTGRHPGRAWASNPWTWVLTLDPPVLHLPLPETLIRAEELIAQIKLVDARMAEYQAIVDTYAGVRGRLTKQVVRRMQTQHFGEVAVAGYLVDTQFRRVRPLPAPAAAEH